MKTSLRQLVRQTIKESQNQNNVLNNILNDINRLKSNITKKSPTAYVRDGIIHVSGEDGNYFADYYGELNGMDMYIDPRLEAIADKYDMYWDWIDAGSIGLYS